MAVPEAAIDENDGPVLAQHQVGMSRQPRMVQPKPKSAAEQELPNHQLRLSVLALDGRHAAVPLFKGHFVHSVLR